MTLGGSESASFGQASLRCVRLQLDGSECPWTFPRTARASRFGTTPIAPSRRKYSASFSPKIPLKIKTGGQIPRRLRSSKIAAALSSGGWSPTSIRSKGTASINWQASISSHVTVASMSASSSACCSVIGCLDLCREQVLCAVFPWCCS